VSPKGEPPPPHDTDAERHVVASLIVAEDYLPDYDFLAILPTIVQPEDFHGDRERWTYEAVLSLRDRGEQVNQVTVTHELARQLDPNGESRLEQIGGAFYISTLTSDLPTAFGCESWAKIVRRCAVYRRGITAAGQIARAAYQNNGDLPGFLDDLQAHVDAMREMAVPVLGGSIFEKTAGDASLLPLPFILHPHVLEGGGTILFGPPGKGKSYVGYLWAVSVDSGCDSLWAVQQTPTAVVNLERSDRSVRGRLGLINNALGLEETRPLAMLNARGKSLVEVERELREMVDSLGIGFVLFDSISRAGLGKMAEDTTGNLIIDMLNRVCPTWAAIGHTPRDDSTHVFGSIMFEAGADVMVQLLSQSTMSKMGIGLQMTKANDMPLSPLEVFALEFSPVGLKEVRRAKASEFPELAAGRKMSLKEEVIEYLLNVGKASATDIADELHRNRSALAQLLSTDKTFVAVGKHGRSVFYAVAESTFLEA